MVKVRNHVKSFEIDGTYHSNDYFRAFRQLRKRLDLKDLERST